jgi:hypothetical protein
LLSSICSTIAEDWKTSESLSCDESCQTKKSVEHDKQQNTWILKTRGFFRSFMHFRAGFPSRVRRVCTYLHGRKVGYITDEIKGSKTKRWQALRRRFTPFKAKFIRSHLKGEKKTWGQQLFSCSIKWSTNNLDDSRRKGCTLRITAEVSHQSLLWHRSSTELELQIFLLPAAWERQ